jgi:hypothetical protein
MKTKKAIIMAVLSIFLLSILLPACSKKEQAKTTRLYTKQEALKMYHKDQIPEKDHPNDNRHKLADIYINQNFTTKDILIMTASLFGTYGACFGVAYYISFVYATATMPLMSCLLLLPLYIASLTVLPNIR